MSDEMPTWAAAMESRLQAGQTAIHVVTMERLDRLQNSVASIRDDIAANYGTAGAVKRANDNTREELRLLGEVVTTMSQQIQRLQTDVRELKGDP